MSGVWIGEKFIIFTNTIFHSKILGYNVQVYLNKGCVHILYCVTDQLLFDILILAFNAALLQFCNVTGMLNF